MADIEIRPVEVQDRAWIAERATALWGAPYVIAHGERIELGTEPGYVAWNGDRKVGFIMYRSQNAECEITAMAATREGAGVGTQMISFVRQVVQTAGCKRLWLITTNDNLDALRFYQKRGFVMAALHRNAVDRARLLKPEIPATGDHGIPIRDEIELEMLF